MFLIESPPSQRSLNIQNIDNNSDFTVTLIVRVSLQTYLLWRWADRRGMKYGDSKAEFLNGVD